MDNKFAEREREKNRHERNKPKCTYLKLVTEHETKQHEIDIFFLHFLG